MANELPGKLLGVTTDGEFINCQLDATLNLTLNLTESTPCKPSPTETYKSGQTIKRTIDSRDWTITFSAKALAQALANNQNKLAQKLLVGGDPNVQVTFQTTETTDYDFPIVFVYEGEGILQDLTINAPQDGDATHDGTIVANGDLTYTETPVTT